MSKAIEPDKCPGCKLVDFNEMERETAIRGEPVYRCNPCGCIFSKPPVKEKTRQKKLLR